MRTLVMLFAVVMNLVLADAVTKEIAERRLVSGDSFSVIPDFFDFALVHNRGCAWGMFQGQVWPLAIFGIIAMAVVIWQRKRIFDFPNLKCPKFCISCFTLSEPLLYAGILGNVIDRLFRGYVIDMFDFHWRGVYHYPCFNLADVYICTAAGLLILSAFLEKKKDAGEKHS